MPPADDEHRTRPAQAPGEQLAHAVNNSLGVAVANLTLVIERIRAGALREADASGVLDALSQALAGTRKVERVVEALVGENLAGQDGRPADVGRVLDDALALLHEELAGVAITRSYEPVDPVAARALPLLRATSLLLTAAARGLPRANGHRPTIAVHLRPRPGGVEVEVTSSGAGLAAPGERDGGGSSGGARGLDDAVAALRALGADVTLRADGALGSAGLVRLPSAAPGGDGLRCEGGESADRRLRVVVVDDEELILKVIDRILRTEHDVLGFLEPAAALEHLLGTDAPDLVLCDVMMPEMTGMDLFERACAASPLLAERFVFLSGGVSSASARAWLERAARPQLPKPFTAAALRALVRERGGRARSPEG